MDKIEYITNQLKKTFGKKYENYCITRIYNKLDRDDVQFVTQQWVKGKDKKIYYKDLYLPQLGIWIEIDEKHHEKQEEMDKERTKSIKKIEKISNKVKKKYSALDEVLNEPSDPIRIYVYGKTIDEINKKVDDVVDKINKKIKELGNKFEPWDAALIPPEKYIKDGYIRSSYYSKFRVIRDIAKIFGKERPNVRHGYIKVKKDKYIWCPILKIHGFECKENEWENEINDDGTIIKEKQKIDNKNYLNVLNENETRYVFVKYKHPSYNYIYKFLGVYVLDKEKTKKEKIRNWKRISKIIDLKEYSSK